ncbi:MAG: hypothetical protein M3Q19_05995 [Pseudomonadota bacterium]|nr:hypothetical protein [Pseudomonadota bacterium]
MNRTPVYHPTPEDDPDDPFSGLWQRGVRLAKRLAISFALSVAIAIGVGAAATDNAFAQILVTALATFAFWLPLLFVIVRIERFLDQRTARKLMPTKLVEAGNDEDDRSWRRLTAIAPQHAERIAVLRRSIDRSRLALGKADMDPDAHDICVLIDRRLPELIDRELDDLPPDDRNRGHAIGELIDLIEQFARDCSRRRSADSSADKYSAEVLRRRFEAHLSAF